MSTDVLAKRFLFVCAVFFAVVALLVILYWHDLALYSKVNSQPCFITNSITVECKRTEDKVSFYWEVHAITSDGEITLFRKIRKPKDKILKES